MGIQGEKNMERMANILVLLNNLRENSWHITAFPFNYNGVQYIVIFEDIENLNLMPERYIVLLTFIDRLNETRTLRTKANTYSFSVAAKELREYFGIQYGENLGNIFDQFYRFFGQFVPAERVVRFDELTKNAVVRQLSRNDNDNINAVCCFKAIRNGVYDGVQRHRTPFNNDKTKILRPELFNMLGGDDTISFCYRENDSVSDIEIYNQFAKSYGV